MAKMRPGRGLIALKWKALLKSAFRFVVIDDLAAGV